MFKALCPTIGKICGSSQSAEKCSNKFWTSELTREYHGLLREYCLLVLAVGFSPIYLQHRILAVIHLAQPVWHNRNQLSDSFIASFLGFFDHPRGHLSSNVPPEFLLLICPILQPQIWSNLSFDRSSFPLLQYLSGEDSKTIASECFLVSTTHTMIG